jgi:hypothetical protein
MQQQPASHLMPRSRKCNPLLPLCDRQLAQRQTAFLLHRLPRTRKTSQRRETTWPFQQRVIHLRTPLGMRQPAPQAARVRRLVQLQPLLFHHPRLRHRRRILGATHRIPISQRILRTHAWPQRILWPRFLRLHPQLPHRAGRSTFPNHRPCRTRERGLLRKLPHVLPTMSPVPALPQRQTLPRLRAPVRFNGRT